MSRDLYSEDQTKLQKARAQRIDHSYHAKPHPWRRRMFWFSVAAPLIAAIALVAASLTPATAPAFSPGPVSTKHVMFANKCEACHEHENGQWGAVPDAKCQRCHDGPVHDLRQVYHGANTIKIVDAHGKSSEIGSPACATCHAEHSGNSRLADTADRHCTQCHSDLKVSHGELSVENGVDSFKPRNDRHGHPNWHALLTKADGKLAQPDSTALYFNHKFHLTDTHITRNGRMLECIDCHAPDKQRAYMAPVTYAQHCESCHGIAIKALRDIGGARPVLPHDKPVVIEGVVKQAYWNYFIQHGGKLPENAKSGDPGVWLKTSVANALQPLFDPKNDRDANSCTLCHKYTGRENATSLPRIAAVQIPRVWLSHSSFNHETHRVIVCSSCHDRAMNSELTEDVLLPGIDTCFKCHQAPQGARSNCTECHVYHDKKTSQFLGVLTIDGLWQGTPDKPKPPPEPPSAPDAQRPEAKDETPAEKKN